MGCYLHLSLVFLYLLATSKYHVSSKPQEFSLSNSDDLIKFRKNHKQLSPILNLRKMQEQNNKLTYEKCNSILTDFQIKIDNLSSGTEFSNLICELYYKEKFHTTFKKHKDENTFVLPKDIVNSLRQDSYTFKIINTKTNETITNGETGFTSFRKRSHYYNDTFLLEKMNCAFTGLKLDSIDLECTLNSTTSDYQCKNKEGTSVPTGFKSITHNGKVIGQIFVSKKAEQLELDTEKFVITPSKIKENDNIITITHPSFYMGNIGRFYLSTSNQPFKEEKGETPDPDSKEEEDKASNEEENEAPGSNSNEEENDTPGSTPNEEAVWNDTIIRQLTKNEKENTISFVLNVQKGMNYRLKALINSENKTISDVLNTSSKINEEFYVEKETVFYNTKTDSVSVNVILKEELIEKAEAPKTEGGNCVVDENDKKLVKCTYQKPTQSKKTITYKEQNATFFIVTYTFEGSQCSTREAFFKMEMKQNEDQYEIKVKNEGGTQILSKVTSNNELTVVYAIYGNSYSGQQIRFYKSVNEIDVLEEVVTVDGLVENIDEENSIGSVSPTSLKATKASQVLKITLNEQVVTQGIQYFIVTSPEGQTIQSSICNLEEPTNAKSVFSCEFDLSNAYSLGKYTISYKKCGIEYTAQNLVVELVNPNEITQISPRGLLLTDDDTPVSLTLKDSLDKDVQISKVILMHENNTYNCSFYTDYNTKSVDKDTEKKYNKFYLNDCLYPGVYTPEVTFSDGSRFTSSVTFMLDNKEEPKLNSEEETQKVEKYNGFEFGLINVNFKKEIRKGRVEFKPEGKETLLEYFINKEKAIVSTTELGAATKINIIDVLKETDSVIGSIEMKEVEPPFSISRQLYFYDSAVKNGIKIGDEKDFYYKSGDIYLKNTTNYYPTSKNEIVTLATSNGSIFYENAKHLIIFDSIDKIAVVSSLDICTYKKTTQIKIKPRTDLGISVKLSELKIKVGEQEKTLEDKEATYEFSLSSEEDKDYEVKFVHTQNETDGLVYGTISKKSPKEVKSVEVTSSEGVLEIVNGGCVPTNQILLLKSKTGEEKIQITCQKLEEKNSLPCTYPVSAIKTFGEYSLYIDEVNDSNIIGTFKIYKSVDKGKVDFPTTLNYKDSKINVKVQSDEIELTEVTVTYKQMQSQEGQVTLGKGTSSFEVKVENENPQTYNITLSTGEGEKKVEKSYIQTFQLSEPKYELEQSVYLLKTDTKFNLLFDEDPEKVKECASLITTGFGESKKSVTCSVSTTNSKKLECEIPFSKEENQTRAEKDPISVVISINGIESWARQFIVVSYDIEDNCKINSGEIMSLTVKVNTSKDTQLDISFMKINNRNATIVTKEAETEGATTNTFTFLYSSFNNFSNGEYDIYFNGTKINEKFSIYRGFKFGDLSTSKENKAYSTEKEQSLNFSVTNELAFESFKEEENIKLFLTPFEGGEEGGEDDKKKFLTCNKGEKELLCTISQKLTGLFNVSYADKCNKNSTIRNLRINFKEEQSFVELSKYQLKDEDKEGDRKIKLTYSTNTIQDEEPVSISLIDYYDDTETSINENLKKNEDVPISDEIYGKFYLRNQVAGKVFTSLKPILIYDKDFTLTSNSQNIFQGVSTNQVRIKTDNTNLHPKRISLSLKKTPLQFEVKKGSEGKNEIQITTDISLTETGNQEISIKDEASTPVVKFTVTVLAIPQFELVNTAIYIKEKDNQTIKIKFTGDKIEDSKLKSSLFTAVFCGKYQMTMSEITSKEATLTFPSEAYIDQQLYMSEYKVYLYYQGSSKPLESTNSIVLLNTITGIPKVTSQYLYYLNSEKTVTYIQFDRRIFPGLKGSISVGGSENIDVESSSFNQVKVSFKNDIPEKNTIKIFDNSVTKRKKMFTCKYPLIPHKTSQNLFECSLCNDISSSAPYANMNDKGEGECLEGCPKEKFIQGNQCVESCPDLIDNGVCVDSCPEGKAKMFSDSKECQPCSQVIYEGVCVTECPFGTKNSLNNCVSMEESEIRDFDFSLFDKEISNTLNLFKTPSQNKFGLEYAKDMNNKKLLNQIKTVSKFAKLNQTFFTKYINKSDPQENVVKNLVNVAKDTVAQIPYIQDVEEKKEFIKNSFEILGLALFSNFHSKNPQETGTQRRLQDSNEQDTKNLFSEAGGALEEFLKTNPEEAMEVTDQTGTISGMVYLNSQVDNAKKVAAESNLPFYTLRTLQSNINYITLTLHSPVSETLGSKSDVSKVELKDEDGTSFSVNDLNGSILEGTIPYQSISNKETGGMMNSGLFDYYLEKGINIYNSKDISYSDPCYSMKNLNFDLTQKYKKQMIFQKVSFNGGVNSECTYEGVDSTKKEIFMSCSIGLPNEEMIYSIELSNKGNTLDDHVDNLPLKCLGKIGNISDNLAFWLYMCVILFVLIVTAFSFNFKKMRKPVPPKKLSEEQNEIADNVSQYSDDSQAKNKNEDKIEDKNLDGTKSISRREDFSHNKILMMEDIKLNEEPKKKKKKSLKKIPEKEDLMGIIIKNMMTLHPVTSTCKTFSLTSPKWMNSLILIFNVCILFGFEALYLNENYIEDRIYRSNRDNFTYPMRYEFELIMASIVTAWALTAIVRAICMISTEQRSYIEDELKKAKGDEKAKEEVISKFNSSQMIKRAISIGFMVILVAFFYVYTVGFCGVYKKTQYSWFYAGIWCLFMDWIVFGPFYIIIISILENSGNIVSRYMKDLFIF